MATALNEMKLKKNLHTEEDQAGVFRAASTQYGVHTAICMAIIACVLYAITLGWDWKISCIGLALVSAFVKTQLAFNSHDAGHNQWFRRKRYNELANRALTCVLGLSGILWVKSHNAHHRHPNHLELDPNVKVSIFTFHPSQGTGFWRRHQALYYFFAVPLVIPLMRQQGMKMILAREHRDWWLELAGMIFYAVSSVVFLFIFLGPIGMLLFLLVQEYALGLYLGSVFASNHKGMRIIEPGEKVGILTEQLETSRDVTSNWLIDFLMGGLNHQCIHHIFPAISRWRLSEATIVLEDFCNKNGLFYKRTGLFRAYRDIIKSLALNGKGVSTLAWG